MLNGVWTVQKRKSTYLLQKCIGSSDGRASRLRRLSNEGGAPKRMKDFDQSPDWPTTDPRDRSAMPNRC